MNTLKYSAKHVAQCWRDMQEADIRHRNRMNHLADLSRIEGMAVQHCSLDELILIVAARIEHTNGMDFVGHTRVSDDAMLTIYNAIEGKVFS